MLFRFAPVCWPFLGRIPADVVNSNNKPTSLADIESYPQRPGALRLPQPTWEVPPDAAAAPAAAPAAAAAPAVPAAKAAAAPAAAEEAAAWGRRLAAGRSHLGKPTSNLGPQRERIRQCRVFEGGIE